MPLLDPTRILNNLIVLGILAWIFFLVWSKMDQEKTRETWNNLKNLFGGKKE